jgi:hypothetical protein
MKISIILRDLLSIENCIYKSDLKLSVHSFKGFGRRRGLGWTGIIGPSHEIPIGYYKIKCGASYIIIRLMWCIYLMMHHQH